MFVLLCGKLFCCGCATREGRAALLYCWLANMINYN